MKDFEFEESMENNNNDLAYNSIIISFYFEKKKFKKLDMVN